MSVDINQRGGAGAGRGGEESLVCGFLFRLAAEVDAAISAFIRKRSLTQEITSKSLVCQEETTRRSDYAGLQVSLKAGG